MEIERRLLALMLVFGFVVGTSLHINHLIIVFIRPPFNLMLIIPSILQTINITIFIVIFAVLYVIGKRLDLKTKLNSVVVSLSIGCFLGSLIGIAAIVVVLISIGENSVYNGLFGFVLTLVNVTLYSLSTSLGLFFGSFSALALAYLRTNFAERTQ